eukprot:3282266-Rhodomonas_salina.1
MNLFEDERIARDLILLIWIICIVWITTEHVKFSTIVITFIIRYACGVVSVLGVIYYFILIRFEINIFEPSMQNIICSRST